MADHWAQVLHIYICRDATKCPSLCWVPTFFSTRSISVFWSIDYPPKRVVFITFMKNTFSLGRLRVSWFQFLFPQEARMIEAFSLQSAGFLGSAGICHVGTEQESVWGTACFALDVFILRYISQCWECFYGNLSNLGWGCFHGSQCEPVKLVLF